MRSLFLALVVSSAAFAEAPLSDIVKVPRPEKGEFMGLYLKGQKIGYMYSSIALSPGKDTVISINEMHFRAKVGPNAISDRMMKETRIYESKPGGRLLSFVMEQRVTAAISRSRAPRCPRACAWCARKRASPTR